MNNKLFTYFVVFVMFVLGACIPDDRPIILGVYESQFGEERITVSSTKIQIYIKSRVVRSLEGKYVSGNYEYRVNKDKRIFLNMSSNDFSVIEYNAYEWYWQNNNILRVDVETGEKTWFLKATD